MHEQHGRSAAFQFHADRLMINHVVVAAIDATAIRPDLQRATPGRRAGVLGDGGDGPPTVVEGCVQAGYQPASQACERGMVKIEGSD